MTPRLPGAPISALASALLLGASPAPLLHEGTREAGAAAPDTGAIPTTVPSSPPTHRSLIGFAPTGDMIVLETAGKQSARIAAFVLPSGPLKRLMVLAAPTSSRTIDALRRDRGWRSANVLPRIQQTSPTAGIVGQWNIGDEIAITLLVEAALGDRREGRLVAQRGGDDVLLERMPIVGTLTPGALSLAPDERHLVLSTDHDGQNSLHVLDVRAIDASLSNRAGLRAFLAGERVRARALFEKAAARDPRLGDAIYNLACVHSVLGDRAQAVADLSIALALDPVRFVRLARTDPDLEAVREHPEICRALLTCRP